MCRCRCRYGYICRCGSGLWFQSPSSSSSFPISLNSISWLLLVRQHTHTHTQAALIILPSLRNQPTVRLQATVSAQNCIIELFISLSPSHSITRVCTVSTTVFFSMLYSRKMSVALSLGLIKSKSCLLSARLLCDPCSSLTFWAVFSCVCVCELIHVLSDHVHRICK